MKTCPSYSSLCYCPRGIFPFFLFVLHSATGICTLARMHPVFAAEKPALPSPRTLPAHETSASPLGHWPVGSMVNPMVEEGKVELVAREEMSEEETRRGLQNGGDCQICRCSRVRLAFGHPRNTSVCGIICHDLSAREVSRNILVAWVRHFGDLGGVEPDIRRSGAPVVLL